MMEKLTNIRAAEVIKPVTCIFAVLLCCFSPVFSGEAFSESSCFRLRDGRVLSYSEYGQKDGTLAFFFHGISGSRFDPLLSSDIERHGVRLIAVDRPGTGESTFDGDRTILSWIDDVEQMADHFGSRGKKFGIIAISGGASYGCACALRLPHRVSHLALVSPMCPTNSPGVQQTRSKNRIAFAANHPNISKLRARAQSKKARQNIAKLAERLSSTWAEADQDLVAENQEAFQKIVSAALNQEGIGMVSDVILQHQDWGFKLCQIKDVPVSVWKGKLDPVVNDEMAYYFRDQINGASLVIGKNEGHFTMVRSYADEILGKF